MISLYSLLTICSESIMKKLFLLLAIFLLLSTNAYAYLDPGTGSMILQSLIAIFVIAGSTVGIFWQKIKSMFSKSKEDKTDKPE